MGWIELATPITHLWYLKGSISYISILLNIATYIAQKLYHQLSKHKLNHENIHRLLKQMMLFYPMTRTILMEMGTFRPIGSVLLAQNHVPLIFQFQS
jgi:DNA-directed RNA polymerase beta' subunit